MATALLLLPLLHHTYCLCCTTPTAIAALPLQVHPVTIVALNVPETYVETRFYCPQPFLSLDFHCRMNVSELK